MSKLLLIDGNSIINRGFYGLPDLTTAEGLHTNGVLGFLNIFFKVYEEEKPDGIIVAFDLKAPTFRHLMFDAYKGTRKPSPDELRQQFPILKELLTKMNIKYVEKEGYEADDILGTYSRLGVAEGYDVTVLSGDRDLLQVATDKIQVRIPKTKAGVTIIENYYAADVESTYGVDPIKFIDVKGLMGDKSDNIPGVPSIGEKTASKLIQAYGSIENIIDHIDEVKPDKARKMIDEHREAAIMSKILATIKLDCELEMNVNESVVTFAEMFNQDSYQMLQRLEFRSIINRYTFTDLPKEEFKLETTVIDDMSDFLDVCASLSKRIKKEKKEAVAIGLKPIIDTANDMIGLAISLIDKTYLVQIINFITEDLVIGEIRKLMEDGAVLCFNGLKENIRRFSFSENESLFDIKIAAYLLDPLADKYEYPELAKKYLDLYLKDEKELIGKDEINSFSIVEGDIRDRYAFDAYVNEKCYEVLCEKLKEEKMYDLYTNIEFPLVFCLKEMEANGILADKEALVKFGEKLKDRISELTKEIHELCGEEFNINSTKKLGEILFEKLQLKAGKKTKSGYSTSVEVLEKIKDDHPVIPLILEYRQLTKLNSTYVEGLGAYIKEDGRIHGCFNQTVTATGRISSTEPNLQNIPTRMELGREIRRVFIPREGYTFIDADYSQIELRVLAHLSNDEKLIEAYNKSLDIHAITASEVFDVPLDAVDSLMRRKAKAVNFGIVYGISSFGLGQDLDVSRKEAQQYIDKYFERYQGVKKFLDELVQSAKEEGYVRTLFNRIRPIPELKSSNFMQRSFGERVAMNSPIQGTAADIIKIAMINVVRELDKRELKSKLILQVHDELLIEAANDEIEEVKALLKECMEHACEMKIPLYIDMHSGASWYDAK